MPRALAGLGQVVAEQVPRAVELARDLVSLAAGGNDILCGTDVDELAALFEPAVAKLQAAGIKAEGRVGSHNAVHAVEAAVKGRHFDEIIVSTLPRHVSRWLRQDLSRRLEHKTQLPVTQIVATT